MNGLQIIEKEITKVRKALKKSDREVEQARSTLREAERVRGQLDKRLKQLEEARTICLAEQDKALKAAGLAMPVNAAAAPQTT